MSGAEHNLERTPRGTFDARQWRALVRLRLRMALRPTIDSTTGKVRIRPLRALILSYAILGASFAPNASRFADVRSFAIALFASVLAIGVFTILPDSVENQRRDLEIIHAKPIRPQTMLLARLAHVFFMVGLMTTALGTAPFIALLVRFAPPTPTALALAAMLYVGAFLVALFWVLAQTWILRLVPLERVRSRTQLFLVVTLVAFGSSTMILQSASRGADDAPIELSSELFRLLPPAWLVDFVIGDPSLWTRLERILVLALFAGAALLTFASSRATPGDGQEHILDAYAELGHPPLALRLLERLRRAPRFGPRLLPAKAFAIARLLITHAHREPTARARVLPLRIFLIGAALFDRLALGVDTPVPEGLGLMALLEGIRLTTQSPQANASWMIASRPVSPKDILAGVRIVALTDLFTLPFFVALASSASFLSSIQEVLLCGLTYLIEGDIVTSLGIGADPAWPLSREQRMPLMFTYFTSWIFIVALAVVTRRRQNAMAILVLLVAALVARRWAAKRLATRLSCDFAA